MDAAVAARVLHLAPSLAVSGVVDIDALAAVCIGAGLPAKDAARAAQRLISGYDGAGTGAITLEMLAQALQPAIAAASTTASTSPPTPQSLLAVRAPLPQAEVDVEAVDPVLRLALWRIYNVVAGERPQPVDVAKLQHILNDTRLMSVLRLEKTSAVDAADLQQLFGDDRSLSFSAFVGYLAPYVTLRTPSPPATPTTAGADLQSAKDALRTSISIAFAELGKAVFLASRPQILPALHYAVSLIQHLEADCNSSSTVDAAGLAAAWQARCQQILAQLGKPRRSASQVQAAVTREHLSALDRWVQQQREKAQIGLHPEQQQLPQPGNEVAVVAVKRFQHAEDELKMAVAALHQLQAELEKQTRGELQRAIEAEARHGRELAAALAGPKLTEDKATAEPRQSEKSMEARLAEAQLQLKANEAMLHRLQEELDTRAKNEAMLRTHIAKLEAADGTQEKTLLVQATRELADECIRLRQEAHEAQMQLETLQIQGAGESGLEQPSATDIQRHIRLLTQQLEDSERERHEAVTQCANLMQELEQLRSGGATGAAAVGGKQPPANQLQQELRGARQQLRDHHTQRRQEMGAAHGRLSELEEELAASRRECERLRQELEGAGSGASGVGEDGGRQTTIVMRSKELRSAMTPEQIFQLRRAYDDVRHERDALQAQIQWYQQAAAKPAVLMPLRPPPPNQQHPADVSGSTTLPRETARASPAGTFGLPGPLATGPAAVPPPLQTVTQPRGMSPDSGALMSSSSGRQSAAPFSAGLAGGANANVTAGEEARG